MPVEKCPICGGAIVTKQVEKLLRGGVHIASMQVEANVCLICGEQYYSVETVRRFEQIVTQLERQEFNQLQPMGRSFRVA